MPAFVPDGERIPVRSLLMYAALYACIVWTCLQQISKELMVEHQRFMRTSAVTSLNFNTFTAAAQPCLHQLRVGLVEGPDLVL